MRKITLMLVLLFSSTSIFAQGEFVIELDPATGTFVKNGGPIPGIHWVYPNIRAYDEVNGRLIFQGGDPIPDHLYSIDVLTGATVYNPSFPSSGGQSSVSEPQFDNTNETLYGLYYNDTISSYFLVTIDPSTGVHTQIGANPITGLTGISQGMDTYDEIHHRYMVYSGNVLYSIDAVTGDPLTSTTLNLQTGDGIMNVSFNNANDTLYGLMLESTSQLFFLVWIDPVTGDVTQIGNGTNLAYGNLTATIDEANRQYIYCYSDQTGFYLSVMSLVTGDIIYNNQIVLGGSVDNVLNLKYDNTMQKLFAIHWDEVIETSDVANVSGGVAQVYPNPASDEVLVRFTKNYQDIHVTLYGVNGQELRSVDLQQASEHTFQLNDLSAGVYFLRFDTPEESFSARFIKK